MELQELRPRFYEGQYLGADDLSSIVVYLRTAQARHALGAHTWGIAIGLQLTETAAPGAPNRVEVTLQPGFAWDGYARPIANARPTRLNEDLFAAIPFHPVLDDVAAGGTGRLVEVWLSYAEIATGNPQPGFETCATDDPHDRIGETFRFEIGQQPVSRQRDRVTIGTNAMDAEQALKTFDATAAPLYDTSVPHQQFPFEVKPPRWLIPIGYVRWIARDQALGYFAERDLDPAQQVNGRVRAFRRYVGAVAEYIEAADGAIVLHHRGKSPTTAHYLQTLLASTLDPGPLLDDLVWVEGNLRVVGTTKLCGDIHWRNNDGLDEGTPFFMARRGDTPAIPAAGNRDLRIVIGPDAQTDNRLIVGPEVPGVAPAPPTIAPRFVVVSGGDVGIGTRDPATRLNVIGERIRLQDDAAGTKCIDLRTSGNGVGVESSTDTLTVRGFGPGAQNKNRVLINPENTDGAVGIRVQNPQHDVDARGRSIRLGLDQDGGGQLVLTHAGPNNIFLEARNAAGTGAATELRTVGPGGVNVPLVSTRADLTHISNRLVVGHAAPQYDVDIRAHGIKLGLEANGGGQLVIVCNPNDNRVYLEGFSTNGAGHADEMLITGRAAQTLPVFTVRSSIAQFTGDVGIGTATPQQALHVAGGAIRVDGAGDERAYIGGDGVANDVQVGSMQNGVNQVALWNTASATFMDLRCDDITCDDIDCDDLTENSDAALKSHIKPVGDALETLARLRGVRFRWTEKGARPGEKALGVVAQEVREVLPEAVRDTRKGIGVRYSALIPVLIEAVKELKAEVDALRSEIKALKGRAPRAAKKPRVKKEEP